MFQESFNGVLSKIKFQGNFNGVSSAFQGSFKRVSREFQVCLMKVLRLFQEKIMGVSWKFEVCF